MVMVIDNLIHVLASPSGTKAMEMASTFKPNL